MSIAAPRDPIIADSERPSTRTWILLALLVVSISINYVDRANLSAAADQLSHELSLDDERRGLLLSSFFWSYMLFQIPSGWLISRFNVYWVYAIGYFVWSLATAAIGFVSKTGLSFGILFPSAAHADIAVTGAFSAYSLIFSCRLVLGMAEACAYPSYSKIIASSFPEHKRGLANALIDAGSKTGPALGLMICGSLVAGAGWRIMFISVGLTSMLWLIPWILTIRGVKAGTRHGAIQSTPTPPLLEIFTKRQAWGTFFGLLCSNYAWYFLLTWLPSYFRRERHYSEQMTATIGSIPYWGVAAASIFGGWLSDYLISRGASASVVRKWFVVCGLSGATLLWPAALAPNPVVSMILMTVACIAFGFYTSNVWAVTQRLAGPGAAAEWTGIQNTFGNISGIAAPYITGLIVQKQHSFNAAFIAVSAIVLAGACSFLFLVGHVAPVTWKSANLHGNPK